MPRPLDGMRVLDLTRLLPGAVLTMMLVDLGAEVIKIEDPHGGDYARWSGPKIDGQSVFFRMNNRSKRSVIINLKTEAGQAVLKRLVATADVLVEGFRPGVMARLGCAAETLREINPCLVTCSLSGWGVDGPKAQDAGHDLNYVAAAGLLGTMESPQVLGGQIADLGGTYVAVAGILAALLHRERTGQGSHVDTSLAESALPFMLYNWVEALTMGASPGQGMLTGGLACYRVYHTGDGQPVALAALEPKFWTNFCRMIQRPDLIDGYDEPAHQEALRTELESVFATKTAAEWESLLADADCCFTRVTDTAVLAKDPHFQARGMLGQFPDGTPWIRSPLRLAGVEVMPVNDIPGYGEHTEDVLLEVGYSEDEIALLKETGAISLSPGSPMSAE